MYDAITFVALNPKFVSPHVSVLQSLKVLFYSVSVMQVLSPIQCNNERLGVEF